MAPLTIEDLRNPDRKSGFNYVVGAAGQAERARGEVWWRAQYGGRPSRSGLVINKAWWGPRQTDSAAAAQDYCDYVNSGAATPATPRLKSAGHTYAKPGAASDPEVEAALGTLRDARAQRKGIKGFVYCIGETGVDDYVKIGYGVNPEKRVAELQTGNPRKLYLIGKVPGSLKTEGEYHRRFITNNELGEWFKRTPEIIKEFT